MTSSWTVRRTTSRDEDFLWEMLFYASHSNDEEGARLEDVRSNPDLTGYVEGWKKSGMVGVIAAGAVDLGAAWLRALDDSERDNPVFVDASVPELAAAVRPGTEGLGVGTLMINAVIDLARGVFPAIVLSSRAENPAVRLYERLGFATVGEMTNRVGTKSVKMIIELQ